MSELADTEVEETYVQFSCTKKYLENFIDSVDNFRDEGKLIFSDNRIFSKVADPANVGMCISKIEGQALNGLDVVNTDQIVIGVLFEKITDCLSGISATSDIEVTWPVSSSAGTRLMRLDVIDEDIQFEISTLNPDTVPQMPSADPLSHSTQIEVDGDELKSAISHADKMVDSDESGVSFQTFDQVFQISSSDKTEGNFKKQFHASSPSSDATFNEHQTSISINYLDEIAKLFGKADLVTVHVKEDNPVRFDLTLDDAGDAEVIYIIAPRLDSQ